MVKGRIYICRSCLTPCILIDPRAVRDDLDKCPFTGEYADWKRIEEFEIYRGGFILNPEGEEKQ